MRKGAALACTLLLVLLCSVPSEGKEYKDGEIVSFFVNTIGPFANPSEIYRYYSLPVCAPKSGNRDPHRGFHLGETLEGDKFLRSLYELKFKDNEEDKPLCQRTFTLSDINTLKQAIDEHYYWELICDGLPVHGFLGTTDIATGNHYLFTHVEFKLLYNGERIIAVNATSTASDVVELETLAALSTDAARKVSFTYSVKWFPTDISFERRNYLASEFFNSEMEIHWLAIMNSFVLVILLTGFLAIIIMRVLKSDYTRYNDEEQDEEDYGWKLIHGDVFRFPPNKNLFCACVGVGAQFLCVAIGILLLALAGMFHPNSRGSLYTVAIVLYALTSAIGGYVSGNLFRKMGGQKWAWNIMLTAGLFVVPFVMIFSVVNSVAISYGSTTAVPFSGIIVVFLILVFVGLPLTILGGIAGRRIGSGEFEAPCRTKNFPREIPLIPWYRQAPMQMVMAGFLPFSAIYIELYYIYSSVWGHNAYTLFGILFLVFIILIIVTACITIALTYFQLSMEDYRWWWRSFASGGSTGLFIYVYSFFYFMYRSEMHGFLQLSFYFGYMALVCWFFFIMLGTVGFYSSLLFVRSIYRQIHID
ncbi:Transmembrane 9 superfamily member [Balamuthia mandrillaris]